MLQTLTEDNTLCRVRLAIADITQLVIEEFSQWVIGQNVTGFSDICDIDGKCLFLPGISKQLHRIPFNGDDVHSYLTVDTFYTGA